MVTLELHEMHRLVDLVAAKQREECAKLCESQSDLEYATGKVDHNERSWCDHLAEAIRSQKP
jgi:hypothetical protein